MLSWSSNFGNKLFGADPKLEFVKPGQGAHRLAGSFLTLPTSPQDLPLLLPSHILLSGLQRNPSNLFALVRVLVSNLKTFVITPRFPRSEEEAHKAINAVRVLSRVVPVLLGPQMTDADGRRRSEDIEEKVFWAREKVLRQREKAKPGEPEPQGQAAQEGDGQFVLEDEDDDDESSPSASTPIAAEPAALEPEYDKLPPLALTLLSTLVDLLFVPGFTLPLSLRQEGTGVCYSIWEKGVASPTSLPAVQPSTLGRRREILSLLTLLISLPSLLTPPGLFSTLPNRWRDTLISGAAAGRGDRNVVLCLLCSVVNTALAPPTRRASGAAGGGAVEGDGLRERAARLAQEAARAGAGQEEEQARKELVLACLQFLGVVLAEHAPAAGSESGIVDTSSVAEGQKKDKKLDDNLFAFYLSRLHRPADLFFLLSGLLSLLSASLAPSASSSFLPLPLPSSSTTSKRTGTANESLVVLWRLLEGNKKFREYATKAEKEEGGRARTMQVLVAVVACAGDWKGEETHLGLLRLSLYLLQSLTSTISTCALPSLSAANPPLALLLAEPLSPELIGDRLYGVVKRQCAAEGTDWFEGNEDAKAVNAGEFLIIALHSLLLPSPSTASALSPTYRSALSALHTPILLSLSNLSPFLRDIGKGSGEADRRLLRVWMALSAPAFLVGEEGRPRGVYYLLETFNNLVIYNFASNAHFLHCLLLTRRRLETLSTFTLASGVAAAQRLRVARRARQTGGAPSPGLGAIPEDVTASPLLSPRGEEGEAGSTASEKALGKRRERSLSVGSLSSLTADLALSSPALASPGEGTSRESLDLSGMSGEQRPFVGKNGFVPTEDWVSSWRDGLPLRTLLTLLSNLSNAAPPSPSPTDLLPLLTSPSLTSSLPSPSSLPPPKSRPFALTPASTTWLASVVYGRVYLSQLEYLRDLLPVQLFAVAQAPGSRSYGLSSGGSSGSGGGVVGAVQEGLGRELESVGRRVGEVGGWVGGAVGGLFAQAGVRP
ncbi:hypothetical protein JCM11641_008300 [Rhodosporidiobolus odoratus]